MIQRYVLKCNDSDKDTGFLGYIPIIPKVGPSNKVKTIVLADLQDKDIHVYEHREKADLTKRVLVNQGEYRNLSICEIAVSPETLHRQLVEEI